MSLIKRDPNRESSPRCFDILVTDCAIYKIPSSFILEILPEKLPCGKYKNVKPIVTSSDHSNVKVSLLPDRATRDCPLIHCYQVHHTCGGSVPLSIKFNAPREATELSLAEVLRAVRLSVGNQRISIPICFTVTLDGTPEVCFPRDSQFYAFLRNTDGAIDGVANISSGSMADQSVEFSTGSNYGTELPREIYLPVQTFATSTGEFITLVRALSIPYHPQTIHEIHLVLEHSEEASCYLDLKDSPLSDHFLWELFDSHSNEVLTSVAVPISQAHDIFIPRTAMQTVYANIYPSFCNTTEPNSEPIHCVALECNAANPKVLSCGNYKPPVHMPLHQFNRHAKVFDMGAVEFSSAGPVYPRLMVKHLRPMLRGCPSDATQAEIELESIPFTSTDCREYTVKGKELMPHSIPAGLYKMKRFHSSQARPMFVTLEFDNDCDMDSRRYMVGICGEEFLVPIGQNCTFTIWVLEDFGLCEWVRKWFASICRRSKQPYCQWIKQFDFETFLSNLATQDPKYPTPLSLDKTFTDVALTHAMKRQLGIFNDLKHVRNQCETLNEPDTKCSACHRSFGTFDKCFCPCPTRKLEHGVNIFGCINGNSFLNGRGRSHRSENNTLMGRATWDLTFNSSEYCGHYPNLVSFMHRLAWMSTFTVGYFKVTPNQQISVDSVVLPRLYMFKDPLNSENIAGNCAVQSILDARVICEAQHVEFVGAFGGPNSSINEQVGALTFPCETDLEHTGTHIGMLKFVANYCTLDNPKFIQLLTFLKDAHTLFHSTQFNLDGAGPTTLHIILILSIAYKYLNDQLLVSAKVCGKKLEYSLALPGTWHGVHRVITRAWDRIRGGEILKLFHGQRPRKITLVCTDIRKRGAFEKELSFIDICKIPLIDFVDNPEHRIMLGDLAGGDVFASSQMFSTLVQAYQQLPRDGDGEFSFTAEELNEMSHLNHKFHLGDMFAGPAYTVDCESSVVPLDIELTLKQRILEMSMRMTESEVHKYTAGELHSMSLSPDEAHRLDCILRSFYAEGRPNLQEYQLCHSSISVLNLIERMMDELPRDAKSIQHELGRKRPRMV